MGNGIIKWSGGGAVCHYKKIINQIGAVNLSTRGLIMQDYNMYIFTQLSFEMLYLMRPLEMLAPHLPRPPSPKLKSWCCQWKYDALIILSKENNDLMCVN